MFLFFCSSFIFNVSIIVCMSSIVEIQEKIAAAETKLAEAEVAKDEPLVLAYLNYLAELRHKENQLTSTGKQSQTTQE